MRRLVYGFLQLLLSPAPAVGFLRHVVLLRSVNHKQGISNTAYAPFLVRLMLHYSGTRVDHASAAMAPHLPGLSKASVFLMMRGVGKIGRVVGEYPRFFQYPLSESTLITTVITHRTAFFDTVLQDAVAQGVKQVVVLGAGWDCRAHGHFPDVRWFEVDQPPTQEAKIAALEAAGVPTKHVRFAPTDFNQRSWFLALIDAGFQPHQPALVIWEGVTMYLNQEAIEATLQVIAALPAGSSVAFDFIGEELRTAKPPFRVTGSVLKQSMKLYREQFSFGWPTKNGAQAVSEHLGELGLEVERFQSFGQKERSFGGLVWAKSAAAG